MKKLAADNPESFRVHMALADALNTAGDKAGAIKTFERAAQLLPTANGRGNPHAYIARIAEEQKDTDRAIRAYEAVLQIDNADVDSARKLAGPARSEGRRRAHRGRLPPSRGGRSVRQPRHRPRSGGWR